MRVLVTGGAGFIGSHLCDALHGRGDEVWCADNLLLGRREHVNPLLSSPRFHFHEMDVLDQPTLNQIFQEGRFEAVFHLAANSDIQKGMDNHAVDLRLNFLATTEILEAMLRHGVKKLFFASTSAIFGEAKEKLNEDYGPLKPISFYGASKLAAESYLSVFSNIYNFNISILRFPNVVGPRLTHGAVYDFIGKLDRNANELVVLGDGTQRKPYLHVQDLINAVLLVFDKSTAGFSVFHAGSNDQLSVSELVKIVLDEMNLKSCRIKFTGGDRGWAGDVPYFQYDTSKIQALGWQCARGSAEAVRLAVRQILEGRKNRG